VSKYTPGPWKATTRHVTAQETDDRLALDVQINGGNRDDNKANARLIAAAPELLEACKRLLVEVRWESMRADIVTDDAWANIDFAKAAIQKATGEPA